MVGHTAIISFVQEPESYKSTPPDGGVEASIGQWQGTLWQSGDQAGFIFLTGESTKSEGIRAHVWGTKGYTRADIRRFVESLTFGG